MTWHIFKDEAHQGYQIRTKTNASFVQFEDADQERVFLSLVDILNKNEQVSMAEMKTLLMKKQYPENIIINVLQTCVQNDILTLKQHGQADSLFSNAAPLSVEKEQEEFFEQSAQKHIALIGDSELSEVLWSVLKPLPYKKISLKRSMDWTKKEKNEFKKTLNNWVSNEKIHFVIIDANAFNPYLLYHFNAVALDLNLPWLYVGGLEGINLKMGPLFYGRETGCFECLINRLKANADYPTFTAAYEQHLFNNRKSAAPDQYPHRHHYYSILSHWIQMELFYFFEGWHTPQTWKQIVSFNIIDYKMTKHALLKLPYCEACKPELKHAIMPWLEGIIQS